MAKYKLSEKLSRITDSVNSFLYSETFVFDCCGTSDSPDNLHLEGLQVETGLQRIHLLCSSLLIKNVEWAYFGGKTLLPRQLVPIF